MVKGETYPQEVLSRGEVAALLAKCSHRSPTGIRNRALLALLHRTGLRIAEALALRVADVDLDPAAGTVTVMRGKGHKRRVVGFPRDAQADVLRWLDCRKQRGLSGHSLLFCTLRGKPMSGQYVRGLLQRLARDAGVDRRVTPHSLRHTWAVELDREGVPMTAIQHGLGHSRLTTTVRYVDHLHPGEVIALTRDRPPVEAA